MLRQGLDVSRQKLASWVGISPATLQRRIKSRGRLTPQESDRVVRLARLLGKATDVLESREQARQWLTTAQRGLGGAVPLDYAQTELGAREVENLLGRLEHGVFS
jgi:putative toxin-antitoxin system antitoxin component (TIGR02293 family)